MNVRAKVRCIGNTTPSWSQDDETVRIARFTPVTGSEGDNADWSRYTPSGYLELVITNPSASGAFEVGKDYLLTFEPVLSGGADLSKAEAHNG